MRAGPLSNSKVIALLNRCFVPVYTVNEEYARLTATLHDGDEVAFLPPVSGG